MLFDSAQRWFERRSDLSVQCTSLCIAHPKVSWQQLGSSSGHLASSLGGASSTDVRAAVPQEAPTRPSVGWRVSLRSYVYISFGSHQKNAMRTHNVHHCIGAIRMFRQYYVPKNVLMGLVAIVVLLVASLAIAGECRRVPYKVLDTWECKDAEGRRTEIERVPYTATPQFRYRTEDGDRGTITKKPYSVFPEYRTTPEPGSRDLFSPLPFERR